jgi:hypothetical protein
VSVEDGVLDAQRQAAVQQVLQRADAGRGGLEQGHDAGRVRRVEEDGGHEEHEERDPRGHAACLETRACKTTPLGYRNVRLTQQTFLFSVFISRLLHVSACLLGHRQANLTQFREMQRGRNTDAIN